ncbi:LysR family transcriptional regulator [Marinomonas pontica]|uniref:LysR family transcriptional regulator n=1 Tax=Marinomonas pontica TaxID=264739 RepID=UPI002243A725|nr:LysR family transcriptional regulator [Marinomonas pontica]MCW8354720.1 LysR family transcriptional regulator [Marinomonas pontica]
MNISTRDFNLLYLFTVLYEEKNLTKSAERMHLSQPALSHKLNKLRTEFDDPLFVRTGRGIAPTPKADKLALDVCSLVKQLERFYTQSESEDLSTRTDSVHLYTTDFIQLFLLPRLLQRVSEVAPKVKIVAHTTGGTLPIKVLEQGGCDLAIAGFYQDIPRHLYRQEVAKFGFTVLYDQNYHSAMTSLSLEKFVQSEHVVTTLTGDLQGLVDNELGKIGKCRNVVLGAASFLALPHVISGTARLLTCLQPIADHFSAVCSGLAYTAPPIPVSDARIEQVWHARTHEDALRKWLRQEVRCILSEKSQSQSKSQN